MTMLHLTRTSQPQGQVGIDWGNPITRGLIAVVTGDLTRNIATGKPLVRFGTQPSRVATNKGITTDFVSACSIATETLQNIGTGDYTDFWFGVPTEVPSSGNQAKFFVGSDNNLSGIAHYGGSFNGATVTVASLNVWSSTWLTSSINPPLGVPITTFNTRKAGSQELWINSKKEVTQASTTNIGAQKLVFGAFIENTSYWYSTNRLLISGRFNRALSDAEIKSLSDNPWQIFAPTSRQIWVPVSGEVISISRPSADVTTTGWTGSPDNTTLFNNIDEVTASDTDYITSPTITGGENITFTINPSLAAGTWDVRYRAQFAGASAQVRIHLLDGSNVSQGVSSWQTVTSSFVTYTASVTTTGTAVRVRIEVQ